jgi:hypothetical protein
MRLPRFRLTVRALMVAVAVAGLTMGIIQERSIQFRELASAYGRGANELGVGFPTPSRGRRSPTITRSGQLVEDGPEAERLDRRYWWLREMAAKYEWAAENPWLPVAPDPPPPDEGPAR